MLSDSSDIESFELDSAQRTIQAALDLYGSNKKRSGTKINLLMNAVKFVMNEQGDREQDNLISLVSTMATFITDQLHLESKLEVDQYDLTTTKSKCADLKTTVDKLRSLPESYELLVNQADQILKACDQSLAHNQTLKSKHDKSLKRILDLLKDATTDEIIEEKSAPNPTNFEILTQMNLEGF